MSSLVISGVRSVAGKITRSGLDTRRSRPPASMMVASEVAMASKTATHLENHRRWDHACMSESPIEPLALGPGEGLAVRNPVGGILTFKVTADQSGGAVTAIDTVAAPGEGPPLHVHRDEDEIVYAVDGMLRLKLADDLI